MYRNDQISKMAIKVTSAMGLYQQTNRNVLKSSTALMKN